MTCEERQPELSAWLDGALDPDEARALEAHLTECATCQAERDALQAVVEQTRGLARARPPAHFAAAVMAGVVGDGAPADLTSDAPAATPAAPPADEAKKTDTPRDGAKRPKMAPFPIRPKISERRAQAAEPPKPKPPVTCADVAEDLSAAFDDEVPPEARARLDLHVANCPACQAERWSLDMMLGNLRLLPRAFVPDGFLAGIIERLEAEERRAQELARLEAEKKARFWSGVGLFARAASVLLCLGVGIGLTKPQEAPRRPSYGSYGPVAASPGPWTPEGARGLNERAEERAGVQKREKQQVVEEPALSSERIGRPIEATLELVAPRGLDQGGTALGGIGPSFGAVLGTRHASNAREMALAVPARRVDDLLEALDRSDALDAAPGAKTAADRVTTESDRLLLKNGFVLVGEVQERPDGYVVTQGDLVQFVPRRNVAPTAPLERADRERVVRLVVQAGAGVRP